MKKLLYEVAYQFLQFTGLALLPVRVRGGLAKTAWWTLILGHLIGVEPMNRNFRNSLDIWRT